MTGFWIGHQMLGDTLGFCAAAHLYSEKIGRPVPVWFDPARRDACQYFDGVVWVPREEIPHAIDCGGTPTPEEWPGLNGVSRFYRYMDPSLQPTKSFDLHFNRPRPNAAEKFIGLITHGSTLGDIDDGVLAEMVAEARRQHPDRRIALIGNFNNTKVPPGVEDRRQTAGDIHWIIHTVANLELLIAPHSGPCYVAAGWRVPQWVYRSREPHWDYALNFESHRITWWDRSDRPPDYSGPGVPLYVNWRSGLGDAIMHISLYYHYARFAGRKLFFNGITRLIDRKMREVMNLARIEQPDLDEWIEQVPVERICATDDGPQDFRGWRVLPTDNCLPEYWTDFNCHSMLSCLIRVMRFGGEDRPADGWDFPHDYFRYPTQNAGSKKIVWHLIGSTLGSYVDNYEIDRATLQALVQKLRDQGYEQVFLQPHELWLRETFPWATFRDHGTDLRALFDEVASARAVFAVNSGVAHVARCCGVPLYLFKVKRCEGLGFYHGDGIFVDENVSLEQTADFQRPMPRIPIRK